MLSERITEIERLSGCMGKICYITRAAAERALKRMRRNRRGKTKRQPMTAYRCASCFQYHIGAVDD